MQGPDQALGLSYGSLYGSFRKLGVPYFGVLNKRILLFRGSILGSPIFGNPMGLRDQGVSESGCGARAMKGSAIGAPGLGRLMKVSWAWVLDIRA